MNLRDLSIYFIKVEQISKISGEENNLYNAQNTRTKETILNSGNIDSFYVESKVWDEA